MPDFINELVDFFKKYNPKIVENSSDPNYRNIYIKLTNHFYLFLSTSPISYMYDTVRIYKANTEYNIDELNELYIILKDDLNLELLKDSKLNPIYDTNDIEFKYIDKYEYECELEKSDEDKYKSVYFYCKSIIEIFDDKLYPDDWCIQDDFHERFFHLCNYVSHLDMVFDKINNSDFCYPSNPKYKDSNNIVLDIKQILFYYLQKKLNYTCL